MRFVFLFSLLGLAACAPAYCDPSGQCHPKEAMQLNRPVLLRMSENPDAIYPGSKRKAYAFALPDSGPFCQVFLPQPNSPMDETWQSLLWHELRHCAEGNYHG